MSNSFHKMLLVSGFAAALFASAAVQAGGRDVPQLPAVVTQHSHPMNEQSLEGVRGQGEQVQAPQAPHLQLAVILWDESGHGERGGKTVQVHNSGVDNIQTQTLTLYR